jgi:peptide-methionine (R)-S-oxide reductase
MTNTLQASRRSASGFDLEPPSDADRARLESGLTDAEREVLLRHGTEAPFCGGLLDNKEDGVYCCRLCGLPLFRAKTKFESGTGWPSFYAPLEQAIGTTEDRSIFMTRTEVHCGNCGGHLGHVFEDGPRPTGLRYCMNGAAMAFEPAGKPAG